MIWAERRGSFGLASLAPVTNASLAPGPRGAHARSRCLLRWPARVAAGPCWNRRRLGGFPRSAAGMPVGMPEVQRFFPQMSGLDAQLGTTAGAQLKETLRHAAGHRTRSVLRHPARKGKRLFLPC
ncbi:uncharacterized protein LOC118257426 isoform X3 [Cygnus atratus]|uniref:uncharacterized protein LOC118257426 isoform X3 n=1 Tax=Cygnus atratus TaxID=8868 RepID=UPI0021B74C0B|nr:uncharacterized protein LOC118257426 isoform X3 [Cygnus atratus]